MFYITASRTYELQWEIVVYS